MTPPPVQIVIISPPGNVHAEAFRELAETLHHGFESLGIPSRIVQNAFDPGGPNLVLGWHLLEPGAESALPRRTILYNLEQMDEGNRPFRDRLVALSRRFEVWDYSPRNIGVLQAAGMAARPLLVPVGFVPQLARIDPLLPKDIDVLFYGSVNDRRGRVLGDLKARGLDVHAVFGVYGQARDALIARAKVVLNLHYYDSNIFEMVRVSYLLSNRKAVVAEQSATTEVDPAFREAMVLAPYDALVQATVDLVGDAAARNRVAGRGFEVMSSLPEAGFLRKALAESRVLKDPHGESGAAPAVSVIVPTRDRPAFLRRALESIQAQTFQDLEVVVVNDGGPSIKAVLAPFRAAGLKVKDLHHPKARGQSAARNAAIRVARGRWIAYLDDDDLYYPDHLAVLVETLGATGAKVAYTDSMRAVEEEVRGQWQVVSRELAMSHPFDRDHFLRDNLTPINNVMHERACWEVCGPHDETLPVLEDWDYWIRLSRRWDFVHIPKPTAEVRWRASGANITFQRGQLFPECRIRIAEKVARALREEAGDPVEAAAAPAGNPLPEAFLFEPDGGSAAWAEVVLAFMAAFQPGEPVALILPLDPGRPGSMALEALQGWILDLARKSGHGSFADIVILERPSELPETLRGYAAVQWVPPVGGSGAALAGSAGQRLTSARQRLAEGR